MTSGEVFRGLQDFYYCTKALRLYFQISLSFLPEAKIFLFAAFHWSNMRNKTNSLISFKPLIKSLRPLALNTAKPTSFYCNLRKP